MEEDGEEELGQKVMAEAIGCHLEFMALFRDGAAGWEGNACIVE